MADMLDTVTDILCRDMKECLADYDVDEELVRNDPEFGASMRLTAEHIILLIQNGTFETDDEREG